LTIVTAISQMDGDYESIKTIESVTDQAVRLKYSSERMQSDLLSSDPPTLRRTTVNRSMRVEDLASAKLYQQQFYEKLPEAIPGTTAIGTSAAVLNALKTKGEVEMGIFNAFNGEPSLDRNLHPNVYDFQMIAKVRRVGMAPVMVPVIVNDVRVELPAVKAEGDFFGDKSEFFFLDDPANPLTLKFRIGIGWIKPVDAETAKLYGTKASPGGDRDTLQVIKISYRCGALERPLPGQQAGQNAPGADLSSAGLEQKLAQTGKVDVYDIFFSFDSDEIREESEPGLKEIAEVLRRHPNWKLSVQGHTDNIAGDSYNLELSRRRAAAVKDALVRRHAIGADRLVTAGFGESRPKDTNDTLEGRARNRRVELVRQ
jgi:outer membrane protein OmpA-like peptidoglycan-associated protein